MEDADHSRMGARQRAQDAAFGAAIGTNVADFDEDAVAVHGRADGMWRNKDVAGQTGLETRIERSGFRDHEAEAVAMHGQAANEGVASRGRLRNGVALTRQPDSPQRRYFSSRIRR